MNEQTDNDLLEAAARLSKAERPQRDLWPEIAAAIEAPLQTTRRKSTLMQPMLAQAAAVVLLVAGSSFITYQLTKNPLTTEVVPADRIFEQASFSRGHTLGSGFQDARNELIAELNSELDRLPPESRVTIEANLALLREAIHETNAALEEEPDNVVLQGKLLNAYQEELAVLRRVSGLSRNVMMRNDI